MNILKIETIGDGGIAHYTFNLANALVKKNVNVVLFTNKKYEFEDEICNFKVYRYMFRLAYYFIKRYTSFDKEIGFYSFFRRVIKLIEYPFNTFQALLIAKKEQINIIHLQSVNETELMMIIAFLLMGYKVVFTIHNVLPRHGQLKFYHRIIYTLIYKLCDHFIIHTKRGKNEITKLFGVKPDRISVIPHGDYKFFVPKVKYHKDDAKTILGIPSECKTILFFGAIRPNKGLENILYAVADIKREIPNIKLMIVGEPCENYERYKRIIEKMGIQEEIYEKLEYIANQAISLYFSAVDIVVLPYEEVTQSGVLQIAYAFGKPVVATNVGGFNEVIEYGKNGYLVSPGDFEALADKIAKIISDKELMKKMGEYSQFLCDIKYSWNSIADSTIDLYSCIISENLKL